MLGRVVTVGVCGVCVGLLSGCGIGVSRSIQQAEIGKYDGDFGYDTPVKGSHSVGMQSTAITLYDRTGVLLAGAGSAGNAYTAQQKAESDAVARGGKVGDQYSYSYETIPPVPGNTTTLTYAWGSTDTFETVPPTGPKLSYPPANGDGPKVDYFLFDLRTRLGNWQLGHFNLGVPLGALWVEYKIFGENLNWIGMPVGLDAAYGVGESLVVSARAITDPVVGGLVAVLQPHGLYAEGGLRVDYRPLSWLAVYADGMTRIVPWEFGDRTGTEHRATLGIALLYKWDEGLKF